MAANGTLIEVLGEVDLPLVLKNKEVIIRGVASDHVAEMLLSIDWLETNGAVWDLRRGELYTSGLGHVLKPKTNGGWDRRVVVQETVQFPARNEIDVAERVLYKDLKNPLVTWDSVPGAPVEEVRVARTILPPCCKGPGKRNELGPLSSHASTGYDTWRTTARWLKIGLVWRRV